MNFEDYLITEGINDKGIFKAIFMVGFPGSGKAQPLYSKIRTPNGWTTMGEIKVGDFVSTPDNKTSKVIQIHEQGIQDIYRVHLYDGRYVDCTEDHLWLVHGFHEKINEKYKRTFTLKTLSELREKIKSSSYKERLFLPIPNEIDFKSENLIIDPYVLGVLIGDGCLSKRISFTNDDIQIIEEVKENITDEYHITTYDDRNYFICPNKGISKYRKELEKLNLWNKKSYEKFIPEKYKKSSIKDRYSIIQGLMDTDGYVDKNGHAVFYTTSNKLMEDFREIIWSLGGNTLVNEKNPFYLNKNNEKINCRKCYCITILHRNTKNFFRIDRKKNRCRDKLTHKKRLFIKIKSIEYIGKDYARCISIDNPNGLYITDGYVVTHNSYTITKIKAGDIEPRIVNTDKFFTLFKDQWNMWDKIGERVKIVNRRQLALYINSVLPMFIDGTGSSTSLVLRRRGILESYGYDVGMVFVNTSLETSLERASKRERKVDPEFIKSAYEQINKAKSFYRSKFSTWMEIDNDKGKLNDSVVLHAFKVTKSFFSSKIINPIGKEYKEKMIENGWKYLDPNIIELSDIERSLQSWYVK